MPREGDLFIADLTLPAGRRLVIPYVYSVIDNVRHSSTIMTPSSMIAKGQTYPIEPEPLETILNEYIITPPDSEGMSSLIRALNFILFESENHKKLNPYHPEASRLLSQFIASSDTVAQQFAMELWEYETREEIKSQLEARVKRNINIRISGQLAAGKTTFLNTISQNLELDAANLEIVRSEPEDTEGYYPELEMIHHYQYGRVTTRDDEATLGDESLRLFCWAPTTEQLAGITIQSAGGHMRADRPQSFEGFGSCALFIDYQLMAELSKIDLLSTDPNFVLSNGESVKETILSLITRLDEWNETSGPKLGVVTKFPLGQNLSTDVLSLVDQTYAKIIDYTRNHFEELNNEAQWSGLEIKIPDSQNVRRSTDHWLPIYDDLPNCSGSVEVLQKLIELAEGREVEPQRIELVSFSEDQQPGFINYKKFLLVSSQK